jgi:mannose-1-phosphate guanylyltransferase
MSRALRSIVLAGGQGQRLSSVTGGVPKQYYAPSAGPTLLEDTLHRLAPVIVPTRTVTVIDRAHEAHVTLVRRRANLGHVVYQPMDRGTAAGVLFGLSALDASETDIVVLTPSDHGVANPEVFRRGLRRAIAAVGTGQAEVVLLAVAPSAPVGDYGWILPARRNGVADDLPAVRSFIEKPDAEHARRLLASGAAWNTMVLVGRVGALLALFREHLPELTRIFSQARMWPGVARAAFLDAHYPSLPVADFSHDLLASASGLQLYVWPHTLGWTDLGTPERLARWLTDQTSPGRRPESDRRAVRPLSALTGGAAA